MNRKVLSEVGWILEVIVSGFVYPLNKLFIVIDTWQLFKYITVINNRASDNERRREFTHIYAKDLSEAIAKWSGICSANEQLVHIVPNPTPDQAWKLYDERRAEE